MILSKLPTTLDGREIPTDFRTWLKYGHIWESSLLNTEKVRLTFKLILKTEPFEGHEDLGKWLNLFAWFYRCGKESRNSLPVRERVLDWAADELTIWADFKMYVGIDLRSARLHWWEFMALFSSLPNHSQIKEIIGLRGMDLSEIKDPTMRQKYADAKAQVALDCNNNDDWW